MRLNEISRGRLKFIMQFNFKWFILSVQVMIKTGKVAFKSMYQARKVYTFLLGLCHSKYKSFTEKASKSIIGIKRVALN